MAAQRGLEGEASAGADCFVQPAHAFAPGGGVGGGLVAAGGGHQFAGELIGVEPGEALAGEQVAADAAFAGAVDAGQHVDDGARAQFLNQMGLWRLCIKREQLSKQD